MKNTIVFIIFSTFIFSCKENANPPYYRLYPETRAWDCYKLHSWWIYKNEATGVLDSVWVKDRSEIREGFSAGANISSFDNLSIKFNSTDTSKNCLLTIRGGSDGNIMILSEFKINGNLFKEFYVTLLKLTPQIENSFQLYTKTDIVESIDTFHLANNVFTNVLHLTCEIVDYDSRYLDNQGYNATDEFWISKHEGIIKKIIRNPIDTTVWTLQRFQTAN
jgi:hypothetical protein